MYFPDLENPSKNFQKEAEKYINMGFNAKPYNNTIRFITRYVIFATTFYYSPSKNSTYATIALFILYHIVKYFSKDQTLITGAINELF